MASATDIMFRGTEELLFAMDIVKFIATMHHSHKPIYFAKPDAIGVADRYRPYVQTHFDENVKKILECFYNEQLITVLGDFTKWNKGNRNRKPPPESFLNDYSYKVYGLADIFKLGISVNGRHFLRFCVAVSVMACFLFESGFVDALDIAVQRIKLTFPPDKRTCNMIWNEVNKAALQYKKDSQQKAAMEAPALLTCRKVPADGISREIKKINSTSNTVNVNNTKHTKRPRNTNETYKRERKETQNTTSKSSNEFAATSVMRLDIESSNDERIPLDDFTQVIGRYIINRSEKTVAGVINNLTKTITDHIEEKSKNTVAAMGNYLSKELISYIEGKCREISSPVVVDLCREIRDYFETKNKKTTNAAEVALEKAIAKFFEINIKENFAAHVADSVVEIANYFETNTGEASAALILSTSSLERGVNHTETVAGETTTAENLENNFQNPSTFSFSHIMQDIADILGFT